MGAKKVAVILIVIGIIAFGYSQYASASQMKVSIVDSVLFNEDQEGLDYDVELQFENPTLLLLTAGKTEFFIFSEDDVIGEGQLEPFVLNPLDSSNVQGTFHRNLDTDDKKNEIKITGVIKYDVFVVSIDIPFVFYPTDDQARKFIHQS